MKGGGTTNDQLEGTPTKVQGHKAMMMMMLTMIVTPMMIMTMTMMMMTMMMMTILINWLATNGQLEEWANGASSP